MSCFTSRRRSEFTPYGSVIKCSMLADNDRTRTTARTLPKQLVHGRRFAYITATIRPACGIVVYGIHRKLPFVVLRTGVFRLLPERFSLVSRCVMLVVLLLSLVWLARAPDWEPAIAFVSALGLFLFVEYKSIESKQENTAFDETYDTDDASSFYASVAPYYDHRNSTFLLQTHRQVIARIREHLNGKTTWHVLDLGAGTGQLIASHFFESMGQWTAVDACPAMVAEFKRNMQQVALKTNLVIEDMDKFIAAPNTAKAYDVVIIALVLSSRSQDPNWRKVAKLVKPGGILIIADIEPSYTAIHPHFSVIANGTTHALRTRPVHLSALANSMAKLGMKKAKFDNVKEEKTTYSFVATFTKPSA